MTWDGVFAELEAEFQAAQIQEVEEEIPHLVHAEVATIRLVDRIRFQRGNDISVRLRNGELRKGLVHEANRAWVMLHDSHRRYLIPYPAISYVWPMSSAAPQARGIESKITLGYALRTIAQAGFSVRLVTDGGELYGQVGMVGADYCDFYTVTAVVTLPWEAIITVEG